MCDNVTATPDMSDDVLTDVARPNTSATLTIRIIKSFTFRTERSLVLHDVNLVTMTVLQLKEIAKQSMFDTIQSLESKYSHDCQMWPLNQVGNRTEMLS